MKKKPWKDPKSEQHIIGKPGRKQYKAGWGRKAALLAQRAK